MLRQIGNTPLIELPPLGAEPAAKICAKLELFNPSGSVKDRIAKYIVEKAERRGELKPGMVIVEVTSGNTGIGFAMVAAAKGYAMRVLMPEHMSEERRMIALAVSEEMAAEDANLYLPRQFENPYNPEAHKLFTGTEIIHQTGGVVDSFVAGVGTGGTIMGVAEAFREAHVPARIVAVEPAEAAVMSGGEPGKHKIQGLGDGFVPNLIDTSLIDTIETVPSDDAIDVARELTNRLGLLVGISSGANVIAALREAERLGPGKKVVTVLPDRGERYFSTELYSSPLGS
jgi:cysteine synthase A